VHVPVDRSRSVSRPDEAACVGGHQRIAASSASSCRSCSIPTSSRRRSPTTARSSTTTTGCATAGNSRSAGRSSAPTRGSPAPRRAPIAVAPSGFVLRRRQPRVLRRALPRDLAASDRAHPVFARLPHRRPRRSRARARRAERRQPVARVRAAGLRQVARGLRGRRCAARDGIIDA